MSAYPAPAMWPRRLLVALGVVALLALATLLFAWNRAAPETAQAANAGSTVAMELKVPTTIVVGEKFTIGISANLTPAEPIAGFAAEVLTSDALKYSGTGNCLAEVKVHRKDQEALQLCKSFASEAGGRGLLVLSSLATSLPSLDVPISAQADLANLSYVCNTVGIQKITLTANPPSLDGAAFGSTSATHIPVKTVLQDGSPVADSAVVNCVEPFDFNGTPVAVGGFQTALGPPAAPGTNAGLLAGVAALAVAALALSGAAWYARRVRRG